MPRSLSSPPPSLLSACSQCPPLPLAPLSPSTGWLAALPRPPPSLTSPSLCLSPSLLLSLLHHYPDTRHTPPSLHRSLLSLSPSLCLWCFGVRLLAVKRICFSSLSLSPSLWKHHRTEKEVGSTQQCRDTYTKHSCTQMQKGLSKNHRAISATKPHTSIRATIFIYFLP